MAAIYRGPRKGYKLTDADTLMLAKSLWGENGPNMTEEEAGAVAWSMMYRFLLIDYRWQREGWTFAQFIQAFSQPVNPDWADPDSPECQKWPEYCTEARIAARQFKIAAGWDTTAKKSPDGVKYAKAFRDGDLPNPFPEIVYDFSAAPKNATGTRGIIIGGNRFLRLVDLKADVAARVIPGDVEIGTSVGKIAWSAVAFAALGFASAWLLDRYGDDIAEFTKKNVG